MRNFLLTIFLLLSPFCYSFCQDLTGAYLANNNDENHLILIKDGYITHTVFTKDTYYRTQGGTFIFQNNNLVINFEFDDNAPDNVGKKHHLSLKTQDNGFYLNDIFFKKHTATKQELDGVWRISGRKSNDKMQNIRKGDRKTIKILVDGFFQWIAINPAEKGFYGSGGGYYRYENGNYQENIIFFSRDNSRVGATLNFVGKIEDNNWHHSGQSSTGNPIYEIWSKEY